MSVYIRSVGRQVSGEFTGMNSRCAIEKLDEDALDRVSGGALPLVVAAARVGYAVYRSFRASTWAGAYARRGALLGASFGASRSIGQYMNRR